MGPQCASVGGAGLSMAPCTPSKMGQELRPQGWESRPRGRLRDCRILCAEHLCNPGPDLPFGQTVRSSQRSI